jgi:serine/threonine protein kinase
VQLVCALEYLHTTLNVVHRDLKPENVLLTEKVCSNNAYMAFRFCAPLHFFPFYLQGHIKLTDFGTAKDETASFADGRQDAFVGTAEYVSPEVLRDDTAHAPADLWALGCVIYQCCTGCPPFRAGSEFLTFQQIIGFDHAATTQAFGGAQNSTADGRRPSASSDTAVPIDLTKGVGAWLERGASFGGFVGVETPEAVEGKGSGEGKEESEQKLWSDGDDEGAGAVGFEDVGVPEPSISTLLPARPPRSLLRFPPSVPESARDLILALLNPDPQQRLGVVHTHHVSHSAADAEESGVATLQHADKHPDSAPSAASHGLRSTFPRPCGPVHLDYALIKSHPFFAGIDWETVCDASTPAPYLPPPVPLPEPRDLSTATLVELDELGLADLGFVRTVAPKQKPDTAGELAALLKSSGIATKDQGAGQSPAKPAPALSKTASGASMVMIDDATIIQNIRTSSDVGFTGRASATNGTGGQLPPSSASSATPGASFTAFGSFFNTSLLSTFFPGAQGENDDSAGHIGPSSASSTPRAYRDAPPGNLMAISVPLVLPRPSPSSPLPVVSLFLEGQASSSVASAPILILGAGRSTPDGPTPPPAGSGQKSLLNFVMENYISDAPETPAPVRSGRTSVTTTADTTITPALVRAETPPSLPPAGRAPTPDKKPQAPTPSRPSQRNSQLAAQHYWSTFLQEGEEVLKFGSVMKRGGSVPAIFLLRSLERDLILVKGPSGVRLLYCAPTTRSLREAWVLSTPDTCKFEAVRAPDSAPAAVATTIGSEGDGAAGHGKPPRIPAVAAARTSATAAAPTPAVTTTANGTPGTPGSAPPRSLPALTAVTAPGPDIAAPSPLARLTSWFAFSQPRRKSTEDASFNIAKGSLESEGSDAGPTKLSRRSVDGADSDSEARMLHPVIIPQGQGSGAGSEPAPVTIPLVRDFDLIVGGRTVELTDATGKALEWRAALEQCFTTVQQQ